MKKPSWMSVRGLKPDDPKPRKWSPLVIEGRRTDHNGCLVIEWGNKHYGVSVCWDKEFTECRLMISNSDQSARRDWREFQRIKNEICGEDWVGYEVYPPESEAVDPSNAFFLWCFPKAQLPPHCGMNGPRFLAPEQAFAPQRGGEP